MDAQMKVDRCIARLLTGYPFWGALVLGMEVEQDKSIPTMATDGVKLFYNPDYVLNQSEVILCTDLAHEGGGHKMFLDHLRRGNRDPQLWNVATDYRINLYLKDSGFQLGDDYLIDEKFRGMDAEEIYDYLLNDPEDPANQKAQAAGGCGCGGLHDCPSKNKKPGSESGPEDTSITNLGESEVMMQLAQARAFAKGQGKLPGSIDKLIEETLNPKISWKQILQRFMESCSQDDFSWQVPDRRFLHLDIYLPGMDSEGIEEFAIVLDTSGSTASLIPQFLSEVSKITSTLKFKKLYVMYCDARVQHVDEYEASDLPIAPKKTYGGGGTDFRPPFAWFEERCINPKGLVYLTDTYGSFPSPPSYPVLWTVPEERMSVPFGEKVVINQ